MIWSREHGLPAEFLPALEHDAPWISCSDGISEDLAPQLLAEGLAPYNLDANRARLLARLLNAHTEHEAPSQVPQRLAASENIERLLNSGRSDAQPGEHDLWLGYESTASFRPTMHLSTVQLPPQSSIAQLVAAAKECPFYATLVFAGPSMQELATVILHTRDG